MVDLKYITRVCIPPKVYFHLPTDILHYRAYDLCVAIYMLTVAPRT